MKIWIGTPLTTAHENSTPGICAQVTKPDGIEYQQVFGWWIDEARGKAWTQVELEGIDERLGKKVGYEDRRKFSKGHTTDRPRKKRPTLSRGISPRRPAQSSREDTVWVCCPNCKRGVEFVESAKKHKLVCTSCKHFFSIEEGTDG